MPNDPDCSACSTKTDGYIAVGTHVDETTGPDVYVIRTANDGSTIWERTYDIQADTTLDEAWSIMELSDGSGFVVVGSTFGPDGLEAFLMKIDCDGVVSWTKTYQGPDNTDSYAFDLIEATSGTTMQGTAAGDILFCGQVENGDFDIEETAWLVRTASNGTVIWSRTYSVGGNPSRFNSLVELSPTVVGGSLQTTNDIFAVGVDADNVGADGAEGYAVRVDGDDGTIDNTNTLQDAVTLGDTLNQELFGVIELANPNETGTNGYQNVVAVGVTETGTRLSPDQEIFLVKFDDGDPCQPNTQGGINLENEAGHDLCEVGFEMTGTTVAQWDLAVTGVTDDDGTDFEVLLVGVDPSDLSPTGLGQIYQHDEDEVGWSLAAVDSIGGRDQGFILCGETTSDWLSDSDPADVHLVNADETGSAGTTCEDSPEFLEVTISYTETCTTPTTVEGSSTTTRTPDDWQRDWGDPVCTGGSKFLAPPRPELDLQLELTSVTRINRK